MPQLDRAAILDAVRQLPPEEQWAIAQAILQMAPRREPPAAPTPDQGTAAALRGIAETNEPLDDTRLLDESRTERYG